MKLVLVFYLLLSVAALAANADSPELQQLRHAYDDAVQRAVRPISDDYLKALIRLKDTFTQRGKPAEAAQVEQEIELVTQKLSAMAATAPSTVGHRTVILDSKVTVPANSPQGYSLGAVRQGDVITLQYLEGLWKAHGAIATDNPDNVSNKEEESRLAIARAPTNGRAGEVIVVVPSNTANKPFSFTFPTTREEVVLRIHKNSENAKNPGIVIYQVKILR